MTETPREYKKRIDEKWEKNEKNKEKLIKKIEGYEILDERFKAKTKQEILANFEKNQKAELQGEKYTTIVAELGKIDKKYEELEDLKRQLKAKKTEKNKIEKEIKGSKLNGEDETTLNLQIVNVRKLDDKLKNLQSEIENFNKKIKDREKEIKEIEESYGKRIVSETKPKEISENNNKAENLQEQTEWQPETLKEVHEQTIKDLWSKDKTRKDIIKILDDGTGIDDELKEKIKAELFKKFFKYYDKKQGNLKVKSARFIKNKVKKGDKESSKMYYYNDKIINMLNPVRTKWKEKITYHNDKNNEYQKKITDALDKIPVNIKIKNGNKIIEFKLGDEDYKLLVVENISEYSDIEYLRHGELYEEGMIGHNPDNRKNEKLAKYIKEQEKKGIIIPPGDYMRDLAKKLSESIGNYSDNQNTRIGHLMYLIGLEGNYRLDDFHKCSNGALARVWLGFEYDYDSRHCLYNSSTYKYAKLLMIYIK